MKIVDPSSIRGPVGAKRAEKPGARSGGFARHLDGADETRGASASGAAAPATGVSGIFGIQEVDERTQSRRRAVLRADTLLDKLDELRHALLLGDLTRSQLGELERLVAVRRGAVDDPELAGLLDEIDLRVQVEIAKYQYNSDA